MLASSKASGVDAFDLVKPVGDFALASAFVLTVTHEENRLFVQAANKQRLEVFPKSKLRFYYKSVKLEIEFSQENSDIAQSIILFQNGLEMPGKKIN